MHVTIESASYASPGFAFSSMGGGTFDPFESMMRPSRSSAFAGTGAASLLGGALGLLGNMASLHAQQQRPVHEPRRRLHRSVYVDDDEESHSVDNSRASEYDEDLAYGTSGRAGGQPRSVLGKLKDRLLDGSKQNKKRIDETDVHAAPVRDEHDGTQDRRRFRREISSDRRREPPRESRLRDSTSSEDDETSTFFDLPPRRQERSTRESSRQNDMIEALERAAEHEKREYLRAKKRFQYASQRTMIDSLYIQQRLDEVKRHERAWLDANESLEKTRRRQRRTRPEPRARPSTSRRQSSRTYDSEDLRDMPFPTGFGGLHTTSRQTPVFATFDPFGGFDPFGHHRAFERLFAQMETDFGTHDDMNGFTFTSSSEAFPKRQTFTSSGAANGASSQRPQAYTSRSSQPPPPPSNPLGPGEAKTLFETYNNHWLTVPAFSPSIMYPTRTLAPAALSDPTTIPHAAAHTWSAEQIMQANTQLFFILGCGLQPSILDGGIVQYNRRTASEADVAMLVVVLKKEKMRWHSDRLGRRNGGAAGAVVNETLQKDERARAVFHGVVALMEYALGRS